MLYKNSVIPFNNEKYLSLDSEISVRVFAEQFKLVSVDGKMWICRTCDNTLHKGKMPVQAKANALQLDPIPNELKDLNALELRLISLRIPFMKMVALPSGKQSYIHGPALNVPSKLDSVCTLLPRLPSQTDLIPLKLKRKLTYKKHYLYSHVRPDKVLMALNWLKCNNPLYSNVSVNSNWVNESSMNNSELFNSL